MADLTKIKFVHEDVDVIIQECKSLYEAALNRQISPSDIEMLLINGLAYRESLIRAGINEAGRQNLVSFSRGAALDYLAEMQGVYRLQATGSFCTLEFSMVAGHSGVVIPEGLRVQSMDGKITFRTIESKVVIAGVLTIQVSAVADQTGDIGNGYDINKINIILDPQAYLSTAKNIDIPSGGADEETDEKLRERIKLAPASFSVAGPKDAYKFFAKSAHPGIVDVAITSPIPGQVNIYPILEDGQLPSSEILDAVQAICNSDKIRPLTDTVITEAPTITNYSIEIELTLLTNAVTEKTVNDVYSVLQTFIESRKNKLGLDVVRNKIASLCMIEGVYNCNVNLPEENIVATPEIYTNCEGIALLITGTSDE